MHIHIPLSELAVGEQFSRGGRRYTCQGYLFVGHHLSTHTPVKEGTSLMMLVKSTSGALSMLASDTIVQVPIADDPVNRTWLDARPKLTSIDVEEDGWNDPE